MWSAGSGAIRAYPRSPAQAVEIGDDGAPIAFEAVVGLAGSQQSVGPEETVVVDLVPLAPGHLHRHLELRVDGLSRCFGELSAPVPVRRFEEFGDEPPVLGLLGEFFQGANRSWCAGHGRSSSIATRSTTIL